MAKERMDGTWLAFWKAKSLSTGGKEVLIKWCNKDKPHAIHWLHWDLLCLSKPLGGLGFQDLEAFNSTLLAKHAWHFQVQKTGLLYQLFKAKYFPSASFLDTSLGSNPSWGWLSIWSTQALLCQGVYSLIGNGSSTHVWKDHWEILKVHISRWDKQDEVIWRPERSGRFSVRSAYKLAISMSNFAGASLLPCPWSSIWRCRTLSKVQRFLWCCCLHAAPVRVALLDRGCVVSPLCPRCGLQEESIVHLMFSCTHSLQKTILSSDFADALSLIYFCVWSIWKARNRLVFEGFLWQPEVVVKKAVASFWEFYDARSLRFSVQDDSVLNLVDLWCLPPSGIVKCNFDSSFYRPSLQGGGGAVFRDFREVVLQAVIFRPFSASSALEAEALVCQRAVLCAMRLGFSCLWSESDALVVVNGVTHRETCPLDIASICFDISRDQRVF
ncbi:uncharacterized protein LOC132267546 [Cornus florida]|uniref:uncharacterized protein LOC132267546 n=1 Tax=Cornus florida TaxID=4283 RepID=UPI00289AFF1E|nr:uncharacterized protein LOC132267546 [Cornus florida]